MVPGPTEAARALQLDTIACVQVAKPSLGNVSVLLSAGCQSSGSLVLGTVGPVLRLCSDQVAWWGAPDEAVLSLKSLARGSAPLPYVLSSISWHISHLWWPVWEARSLCKACKLEKFRRVRNSKERMAKVESTGRVVVMRSERLLGTRSYSAL